MESVSALSCLIYFIVTVDVAYCGHCYYGQLYIVDRSPRTEFCYSEIRRIMWTSDAYCGQAEEAKHL